MNIDVNRPLYSLSVQEFIALSETLIKDTVKTVIGEATPLKPAGNENSGEDETFDITGLAKYLKCSKVSIHAYKKKGLPFYRIGRKIVFNKQEVLDFMKSLRKRYLNR